MRSRSALFSLPGDLIHMRTRAPLSHFLFLALIMVNSIDLRAQSGISSALSGEVTDPGEAAVLGAIVTVTDTSTKATRVSKTDATGHFLFSQINPGTYQVTVKATGFAASQSEPIVVSVGRTVSLNFQLHLQSSNQTVEVTAQQGLLSLDNPNTTTTIEAQTIKNLPNAGQDITFVAQFAQGALMNTAGSSSDAKAPGGYGNVEFNGLPATSNGYILDGFDSNDPWLGLNIGLSTNLVIGLDALQEATVNTNSFAVDEGRYAVAQVNYFTKSGTNAFHGDLYELWNGSLFNAEDYFLHANDSPGNITPKPRSNVNEFGASVGGPIHKNKLFFFGHYEGYRIALPVVDSVTLPTLAYQQYVLGQLTVGGADPVTGTALPAQPAEIPFYQKMFSLLPAPGGTPVAIIGCPLGTGCAVQQQRSMTNSDSENLLVVKIDHAINDKNSVWYRF
jgi:Carboxypeptidase regulatory-like domain